MNNERVSINGTANANTQRRINVSVVFNFVRSRGETYRAEIARGLRLSAPGVSRAVDDLVAAGFLAENGAIPTGRGKPATRTRINQDHAHVLAIDLAKGELKLGYFNFAGESAVPSGTGVLHTGVDLSREPNVLDALLREIARFDDATDGAITARSQTRLLVGLGIPAAVDPNDGRVLGLSILPSLDKLDLKTELETRFGARVYIENDIKLAALAETRLGHARDHRSIVYLDIGNGVGTAIVMDGHVVRGASGYAGEIGYARTDAGRLNRDIDTGRTLEQTASLGALARDASSALSRGVSSALAEAPSPIGAHAVFRAAAEGDQLASSLIADAVDRFALSLLHAVLLVDPEIVVVGGDIYEMPNAESLFVAPLQDTLARALPFPAPPVVFSALGSEACVRGAAHLALDRYTAEHYPFWVDRRIGDAGDDSQGAERGD